MSESLDFQTYEIFEPWKAFFSPSESVPIREAIGRHVSTTFKIYPPGTPLIIQGQVFQEHHLGLIEDAIKNNMTIIGIDEQSCPRVELVRESKSPTRLDGFVIETQRSEAVTQYMANKIGDFFGSGFAALPYRQFALCELDPFVPLPPSLDFERWADSYYIQDIKRAEAARRELLTSAEKVAKSWYDYKDLDSIELPQKFHRWADQDLCRHSMKERFKDPGYVTTVCDKHTGRLRGFLHARICTLERLFETEEWRNPWLFSHFNDPSKWDDPQRFYAKMFRRFGLKPNENTAIISAQILHPEAIGGEVFYSMMRSMALKATPEHAALPLICEIPEDGSAHILNIAATREVDFGILKNGHPLVYCEKLSDALFYFIAEKPHWRYAIKSQILKHRRR